MDHLCGAHILPEETDRFCMGLAKAGIEPLFADASIRQKPDFTSWCVRKWQGAGSEFLWHAERSLFGKLLPSWIQTRGVCVGMGHGRAWQDAVYNELAFGASRGETVAIAWEFLYGRSRTAPGHGRIHGDGSVGAWAAEAGHNDGIVIRGNHGTIDLTQQREDLAIRWGDAGVPAALLQDASGFRAHAVMRCTTTTDVRNALLARYGIARCAARATRPQRDAEGFSGTESSGGHCQCLRGVYRDRRGRTRFVEQQSWPGTAAPHGGGPLQLWDGRTEELPEGAGAIEEDDVETYLRTGEVWAMAPPRNLWRSK